MADPKLTVNLVTSEAIKLAIRETDTIVVPAASSSPIQIELPQGFQSAYGGGGTGGLAISAGASSRGTGVVVFSNSNGITFGLNGSVMTAAHNGLTTAMASDRGSDFVQATALIFGTGVTGTLGSGGISLSVSQSDQVVSAGGNSVTFQTLNFANGNGISFILTNGSIQASHNALTTAMASDRGTDFVQATAVVFGTRITGTIQSNAISLVGESQLNQAVGVVGGSQTFETLSFGNSNGISFSLSNGSVIASYTVPTVTNSTLGILAGTETKSVALLAATNLNNVTLSFSSGAGGSHTLVGSVSPLSSLTVADGGTSATLARLVFSNSNGITFGISGTNGTYTVTASHNGLTSQSNLAFSAGGGSSAFQTLNFRDANGISFSNSGGSVQASYTVPTVTNSSLTVQAGAATLSSVSRIAFLNSNGISFGASTSNNGSISITASHNGLTTARASNDAIGLNTAQSNVTWTVNSSGLSLDARGYAGTATAATNASVTLNSGGISISVNPAAAGVGIEAGTRTATTAGNIRFETGNGITFGLDTPGGSVMTASHNALTSQSNQAFSAGGGSSAFQTLNFRDANGISFSNSNGSVQASYTVPAVTNSSLTIQAGASTLSSVSRIAFVDSNGVSFGASTSNNGSVTITASHNGLTSQSNQAFSANGGSSSFQTLSFGNSNGLTFSNSNGSVIASYTVPTVTNSSWTVSDPSTSGSVARLAFTNLNGVTLSLSTGTGGQHTIVGSHNALTSQSNQAFSAGAASSAFQTLVFQDSNGISFSNNAGSVRLTHGLQFTSNTSAITSAALHTSSPRINLSAGTTSNNLSAVTFGNGNGISFGLNGSTVTASHNGLLTQSNQVVQAGANTANFETLAFNDANGISFALNGGSIEASYAPGVASVAVGADTEARTITAFTLSNSNNIFWGWSAGVDSITAAFSMPVYANGTSILTSAVSFGNINGISFGFETDGSITASHNALTSQSNQAFSAGAASSTFQTLSFQDSNGISFSNNAGAVRVTHALQFTSNTSAITSNALHTSASRVINIVALTGAGGGTASLSGDVSFGASNGISFITGTGNRVFASYTVPTVTNSSLTVSDNATSGSLARLAFTNLNGVTLSLSSTTGGSFTVVGSHNALTTARASNDAIGLNTAQSNVTWTVNSAGLSFDARGYAGTATAATNASVTLNSGGISISVNPAAAGVGIEAGTRTATTAGNLRFETGNGITFGLDTPGGSVMTASHNALTSQSNQAFSAGGGSSAFQTLSFRDTLGMSWSNTGGQVGLASLVFSAFASGNTTQQSSDTMQHSSLVFSGAGIVSVGVSGNKVVISATGGGAGDGVNILAAGTQTANTTGTVVFSNANNITFGMSNSSVITASFSESPRFRALTLGGNTAGTTTFHASNNESIFLHGGNNITLSGNGSSVTLVGPATTSLSAVNNIDLVTNGNTVSVGLDFQSSFENYPFAAATSAITWNGASISHAAAFFVPQPLSISYIRFPVLMTTGSTTIATSATASLSMSADVRTTFNVAIYSMGTGASSQSLQLVLSSSQLWVFSHQVSITNSTQGSYSQGLTVGARGVDLNTSGQYSISATNYSFVSTLFHSLFSSQRFLDIPLGGSLSAGPYWIVAGMSTSANTATAGGNGNSTLAQMTACRVFYSAHYAVSQINSGFGIMGSTNLTSGGQLGQGSFSTGGGGTTGSINISAISTQASNPKMYFQLLRFA